MKAIFLCLLLAGCAVFTEPEVISLIQRAGKAGYVQGWKDALRQSGRGM